jgi:pyruvate dehydrogenase E1 component
MAIYQARFMRYLVDRGCGAQGRKVWAFLGDGEMDEPESLGAITLASREQLDNLIFVVNCNLQRLDGPVRGNGKIIQELEAAFRGAGWNVIKVIWGSDWDPLLARDRTGTCSSAWRRSWTARYSVQGGRAAPTSASTSSASTRSCSRWWPTTGRAAPAPGPRRPRPAQGLCRLQGRRRPKGPADGDPGPDHQGLRPGRGRRGPNITHQQKKLGEEELRHFRTRFNIPIRRR